MILMLPLLFAGVVLHAEEVDTLATVQKSERNMLLNAVWDVPFHKAFY